jgi:hypothetical protein
LAASTLASPLAWGAGTGAKEITLVPPPHFVTDNLMDLLITSAANFFLFCYVAARLAATASTPPAQTRSIWKYSFCFS